MAPLAADFRIACLCALPEELSALWEVLDEEYEDFEHVSNDDACTFVFGRMGDHNVVLAQLAHAGKVHATASIKDLTRTFQRIKFGLLVGIAGGIPSAERDIRLGDIVVSHNGSKPGVIEYDFGKETSEDVLVVSSHVNKSPAELLAAVNRLEAKNMRSRDGPGYYKVIKKLANDDASMVSDMAKRPAPESDVLYGPSLTEDLSTTLDRVGQSTSDVDQPVQRPPRLKKPDMPRVWRGTIGSGDRVIKNVGSRLRLARKHDLICIEMEAAGLMNWIPSIVIKGISDYCDTHKNDDWHSYASVASAAYAKDLIQSLRPMSVSEMSDASEAIQEMERQLSKVQSGVESLQLQVEKSQNAAEKAQIRQHILDWLGSVSFQSKFAEESDRAAPGSGKWFLSSDSFQKWLASNGGLLLASGHAGSGKTVLTTITAKSLREEGDALVACAFCGQEATLSSTDLWKAITRDLLEQVPDLPDDLQRLIRPYYSARLIPDIVKVHNILDGLRKHSKKLVVIIDALDEYRHRDQLLKHILNFTEVVNVMLTTRPDRELSAHFSAAFAADVVASDNDLLLHIRGVIKQSYRLQDFIQRESWLEQSIEQHVVDAAKGVFLFARYHMDFVKEQTCVRDIRSALQALPSSYESLYTTTVERLKQEPPKWRAASKIFALIAVAGASNPPSLLEIQHAFAVRAGDREIDTEGLPHPDTLLSQCIGLVNIRDDKTLEFGHYTAYEFFTSYFDFAEAIEVTDLVVTSLHYCLLDIPMELVETLKANMEAANWWSSASSKALRTVRPFLSLAAQILRSWDEPPGMDETTQELVWSIVNDRDRRRLMLAALLDGRPGENPWDPPALHFASVMGFKHAVGRLTKFDDSKLNTVDDSGRSPLHLAVTYNQPRVFELLLSNSNIDIDSRTNKDETIAYLVASGGWQDLARIVVGDERIALDNCDGKGTSALEVATSCGHVEFVRVLLSSGRVKANESTKSGFSAIHHAVQTGNRDMVEIILRAPNVDPDAKTATGNTPLSFAAAGGHVEICKLLLNIYRVDPQALDNAGWRPLHIAAFAGKVGVLKAFADCKRIDLKSLTSDGYNTLHLALKSPAMKSSQPASFLLATGLFDLDATTPAGESALLLAAYSRSTDTMHELLDRGATNVNASLQADRIPVPRHDLVEQGLTDFHDRMPLYGSGPRGQTALHYQIRSGVDPGGIVGRLLALGADINARNVEGMSPFLQAAFEGHAQAMQSCLATQKVDVNLCDAKGMSAIAHAATNGDTELLPALLSHGVDPFLRDVAGLTPLMTAGMHGWTNATRLLCEHMLAAAASEPDKRKSMLYDPAAPPALDLISSALRTLLRCRTSAANDLVLQTLRTPGQIKASALDLVNEMTGLTRTTLLHIASEHNSLEVVKLCLELGADVNLAAKEGWTPLHFACLGGDPSVVVLLLEQGADPSVKLMSGQTSADLARGGGFLSSAFGWVAARRYDAVIECLGTYEEKNVRKRKIEQDCAPNKAARVEESGFQEDISGS
ncbi:hypothetical protein KVT40_008667 [Elsinoe batatas]|uniref:Ankyrin repeat-containing protein n=1 Tax=Elsinoe batatas TaxID=2601811 RepID=A0A8K0KXC5_9PEZI|nr:hypothetical protein KVT40_008667 [Elsinoe batatas]